MANQWDVSKGKQRMSPPAAPAPAQQEFLFVDAAKAKSSRQGRRNARSFVMQKARRERPWSTSKHAAKLRKSPESTSPATVSTPDLSHTPTTSTPSPTTAHTGTDYFAFTDPNSFPVVKQEYCSDCQIYLCPYGQNLCLKCLPLHPPAPAEDPDNSVFDPFGTASLDTNGRVSNLLRYCKLNIYFPVSRKECLVAEMAGRKARMAIVRLESRDLVTRSNMKQFHANGKATASASYVVTEMAPVAIAVDTRNKSGLMKSHWFDTALGDLGFMHSLLSTVALHQYYGGGGSADAIFFHRAQAISAVNAALRDPDVNVGTSDANIGAVFNLLCVEEALGAPIFEQEKPHDEHPGQRAMHLDGLRRMIQLRGGLMAINSNRILQAFILWHSTAHAIASFDTPYLTSSDLNDAACTPHHPPGYRPNISRHLLECCQSARVKESLTALVQSALILIADLNALFGDTESLLDPLDIKNYACILECMLLNWLRENEHSVKPLEDALCVALVIFTIRTTEALNRTAFRTLHVAASKKLEKALSATARTEWQSGPELLLWILAIGAISAEGSDESSWFVHQASLACSEFSIHSADALLDRLHLCGWVSFKLDEAVRHLWENIVNLRLEPFFDESSIAGPLQVQVASPDFTDWQNVDWSALSPLTSNMNIPAGGFSASPKGGDEVLYDFGSGYAFPHNSPFYIL